MHISQYSDFVCVHYLLENLVWSKLESGRLPSLSEVKSLLSEEPHDIQSKESVYLGE